MRKTFLRKQKLSGEMSLQITSMADVFMMILVFLLKSYGSGTIDVTTSAGLQMPTAIPGHLPAEGLRLEIAQDQIRIEGREVAKISDFAFPRQDLSELGSSKALGAAFADRKPATEPPGQANRMIVVADQRAPYSTIKTVLATAAIHGFTDFKLAVVNPN